ncbi:MAG: FAD:protein FMN transferase [Bacteroidota bacterium]
MYHFEHQAMATYFKLTIAKEEENYAAGAAQACFERLDQLELILSRFVPDSDVSRINRMTAGQELPLERETWDVLHQAISVQAWTAGTFDVGVGAYMDIFRAGKQGVLNAYEVARALEKAQKVKASASLYIDPEWPRAYCVTPGVHFDLGGIGKGYALDQLALLLADLDIENYTISAGDSTLLIRGAPSPEHQYWQFTLTSANERRLLQLTDIAVSATGTTQQGKHIFDPRSGTNTGLSSYDRLWVACPIAAYADALSTGLFLLPPDQLRALLAERPEISWAAYSLEGELIILENNNVSLA